MSTAGRPEADAPAASDIAEKFGSAGFVRLIAAGDGDALAAAALLAGGLDAVDTPYQVSVVPRPDDAGRTTDADLAVALGRQTPAADLTFGLGPPASQTAYDVARTLGNADSVLALAGMVAGGFVPQGDPLETAEKQGVDRRPGIAIPTADPVDGLAHSTLVHGPFSGSLEAAGDVLAGADRSGSNDEVNRRVASLVALAVADDDDGTVRGARRVERFLRPYTAAPVETVGGYADLLDALAREEPGLGVAFALGRVDVEEALPTWRAHGERAHAAVREATTGRYDGLFVVRCRDDAPAGTVARLVRDFRSPEPVVLVVTDGEAVALATDDTDAGAIMQEATTDGAATGTSSVARARFDVDETEFVVAFREAQ